MGCNAKDRL
jgi:hypothetical protein